MKRNGSPKTSGIQEITRVGNEITVSGINIKWRTKEGKCSFENLPVAIMWIDTTLKGLMSGLQSMVGPERFLLALQSQGRDSVEEDWGVISHFPDFKQGFAAIANIAAVAGWGNWELVSLDLENKQCCFTVRNSWEGMYQKALGVSWGSGMLAGKLAGYCSKLFGVNCWATQRKYLAKGDPFDEFWVEPSERSVETEIEQLLATDEATRADMAVALQKLRKEVAERTRVEEELRSTLNKLDATLNALPDLLFEVDRRGRILNYRAPNSSLLYLPPEDFLGKNVDEVLPEPAASICMRTVNEAHQIGRSSGSTYSLQIDGTERWYELSASVSGKAGTSGSHLIVLVRDVTEREQIEKERLRSSKLESVGVLAGGIAHDFNNILSGIIGNISLAQLKLDRDDGIRQILDDAVQACERAAGLTKQLLTFSVGGEPVVKSVYIPDLIEESVRFTLRGSNVRSQFNVQDNVWAVEVDAEQINQAINNLIINADHAMPDGGVITIAIENVDIDSRELVALPVGRYVRIALRDEGTGIAEKHLSKIFDPFFTTKERGSGLGLATTFSIIKKHNGLITVESELGSGTTFYVYLPASEHEIPKASETPAQDGRALVGKKILVMDDEHLVLEIMKKFAQELGCQVVTSENGSDAIAAFRHAIQSGEPFDAVILDLTIPGGPGGKETIKRLLEIDPGIKSIVSSGYSKDPIMSTYKDQGFSAVLAKPFSFEVFREQFVGLFEDQ